jgi:hypothetical protein
MVQQYAVRAQMTGTEIQGMNQVARTEGVRNSVILGGSWATLKQMEVMLKRTLKKQDVRHTLDATDSEQRPSEHREGGESPDQPNDQHLLKKDCAVYTPSPTRGHSRVGLAISYSPSGRRIIGTSLLFVEEATNGQFACLLKYAVYSR